MSMADFVALMGALSPIFAVASALLGVWLGALLEARRERQRALTRREDEQRARIRRRDLRDLSETRQVLIGQLASLEQFAVLGQVSASQPDTDHLTRYNINLVADATVIEEYATLLADLQDALPLTIMDAVVVKVRRIVPKPLAEIDLDLVMRISKTRARLLSALDEQEERVMRDEPLAKLTPEEIASIAPAEVMLERMRDRQRANRSPA